MIAFLKSLCKSTELQVLVIGVALILCLVYETVAKYNKDKILADVRIFILNIKKKWGSAK